MSMIELEQTIFGTAKLGAVIAALERADPEADVHFDFAYLRPTKVQSYRGFYDHLALGWSHASIHDDDGKFLRHWPRAADLLTELKSAVGQTFEGYKGGRYCMDAEMPLWVDRWGEASSTAIKAASIDDGTVVLVTAREA
jgi:hypothetical protein